MTVVKQHERKNYSILVSVNGKCHVVTTCVRANENYGDSCKL